METKAAARWARRSAVLLFVAGVCATFGVSGASARPGLGRAARLPVHGPSVGLGCADPLSGAVQCFGRAIRPAKQDGPEVMAGPTGLGPAQIQSAYKLAGLNASGRTVALVDAYNDPNAASDLNTFRQAYGLPACTTANGCFKQGQPERRHQPAALGRLRLGRGGEPRPRRGLVGVPHVPHPARGGQLGQHLGICPRPRTAPPRRPAWRPSPTATAARRHPRRPRPTAAYNHPGLAITVSSGDSGYGVEYPAASRVRDRRGRHDADAGVERARLDGDRLVRRRQRLLGL